MNPQDGMRYMVLGLKPTNELTEENLKEMENIRKKYQHEFEWEILSIFHNKIVDQGFSKLDLVHIEFERIHGEKGYQRNDLFKILDSLIRQGYLSLIDNATIKLTQLGFDKLNKFKSSPFPVDKF